jgi:hypothetical protein
MEVTNKADNMIALEMPNVTVPLRKEDEGSRDLMLDSTKRTEQAEIRYGKIKGNQ